jgi:hypothetical protein
VRLPGLTDHERQQLKGDAAGYRLRAQMKRGFKASAPVAEYECGLSQFWRSPRNKDHRRQREEDTAKQPAQTQDSTDRDLDVGRPPGLEFALKSGRTLIASEHAPPTDSKAAGSRHDVADARRANVPQAPDVS